MNIIQAIILGIVQGIAEFLPISSSGHLVVFKTLLGLEEPSFFYDVLLHVATLIPIFIVFWEDIFELIKNPFQKTTYLLVIATIPTIIFVILFGDITDRLFATGVFLPFTFIITGILLIFADSYSAKIKNKKEVGYKEAGIIGCMQALGTLPGISRSGSTLAGALVVGVNREKAARFSFLMAIPAILGALVLQLKELFTGDVVIASENYFPMFIGCIAAVLSGYFAINFLLTLIKKAKLRYFSYYIFGLSIVILFCQYILNMQFVVAS